MSDQLFETCGNCIDPRSFDAAAKDAEKVIDILGIVARGAEALISSTEALRPAWEAVAETAEPQAAEQIDSERLKTEDDVAKVAARDGGYLLELGGLCTRINAIDCHLQENAICPRAQQLRSELDEATSNLRFQGIVSGLGDLQDPTL